MSTRASFGVRVLTDPILVELVLNWLALAVAPLLFDSFEERRVPLAWWAALRRVNRTFNAVLMRRRQKNGAPMIWSCWLQYVEPPPSVCTGGVNYPLAIQDATIRVNYWLADTQLKLDVSQMTSFVAFANAFMPNSGLWDITAGGSRLKDHVVAIAKTKGDELFQTDFEPHVFLPTVDVTSALGCLDSAWLLEGQPGKSAAEYAMWCDTTKPSLELLKDYTAIVTNSLLVHDTFAEDILKGMKRMIAKFKYGANHSVKCTCQYVSDIEYICEFYAQRIFCEATYAFAAAVICKCCPSNAVKFDAHFEACVEKIDFQSWLETFKENGQDVYVDQWYAKVLDCLQPVLAGIDKSWALNFEAYELGCIYEIVRNATPPP